MMAYKIPARFKRVAAVFDSQVARARLCESSGSEHSPEVDHDHNLTDLSDLVNSFLEKEQGGTVEVDGDSIIDNGGVGGDNPKLLETDIEGFSEARDVLQNLFIRNQNDDFGVMKRSIVEAVENALPEILVNGIGFSSPDYKRRLMSRLRREGFDAGICKSKWEKSGHCPSGSYEYMDVLMSGNRYIIEVYLGKEFEIAKPSSNYSALLKMFPPILVCQKEELKQVTRLICTSIKKSMKSAGLNVPPWRRLAYTQAKWFSPNYRRTVSEFPTDSNLIKSPSYVDQELISKKRRSVVGFRPVPPIPFHCRDQVFLAAAKMIAPSQVGYLSLALNADDDDDI